MTLVGFTQNGRLLVDDGAIALGDPAFFEAERDEEQPNHPAVVVDESGGRVSVGRPRFVVPTVQHLATLLWPLDSLVRFFALLGAESPLVCGALPSALVICAFERFLARIGAPRAAASERRAASVRFELRSGFSLGRGRLGGGARCNFDVGL